MIAEETLANRLGALALHVTDLIAEATEAAAGRGAMAPAALSSLSRDRRQPIEHLRGELHLSHPATVRLVDRLSQDGLVTREPGPDRRTVVPVLTEAGRATVRRVTKARRDALAGVLTALTSEEAEALGHLLDKLLHAAAPDEPAGGHLCRLCDVPVCETAGPCPVDAGLAARGEGLLA